LEYDSEKMKKICLFFSVLLFVSSFTCAAQEKAPSSHKSQLGITFSSFGSNDLIYFQQLEGAPSYNGEKFFTLGLIYLYPINTKIAIETGIEYSHHEISILPNVPPDMDDTPVSAFMSLVGIPVTARVNFLKYFFFNGGLLLDVDAGTSEQLNSQSGIGALMGLGIKYDSDFRISVFINPYLKVHSLIPFYTSNSHQRLMESGFRFGLAYSL
jgi:hypothetical protein